MDTDDGQIIAQSNAVKRIKLDLDWSEPRTTSNDSGTIEDIEIRPRKPDEIKFELNDPQLTLPYDWWTQAQFRERIRRISSESSISIDSITKEFQIQKDLK